MLTASQLGQSQLSIGAKTIDQVHIFLNDNKDVSLAFHISGNPNFQLF